MKKRLSVFIFTTTVALFLTACWNPRVPEVPITAPWDRMNLPINDDARVWASDVKILKVVHRAAKREVARNYLNALERDGWELTDPPLGTKYAFPFNFEKNGQRIEVYVYDFKNTGVIIEMR